MIRVAESANPLHARLLVGLLEEHGIRACVQGESLWGARGELPFTSASAPSVWVVDETDAARAREIITAQDARPNPSTCFKCGYDLRGLGEARCPECGTTFRHEGEWTCPDCGEISPTQFSHCWKCGADRGDQPASQPPPTGLGVAHPVSAACAWCGGTGRIARSVGPAISIGFALLLLATAISSGANCLRYRIMSAGPFVAGGAAIFCTYLARKLRYKTCACQDDWGDELR